MDAIFRDLRQAKRTMAEQVVPGLMERGSRLEHMASSVDLLVHETDRFNVNAGLIEQRRDRMKLSLGCCCLFLCFMTLFWYLFGFSRMSLVREYNAKTIVIPLPTISK